MRITWKEQHLPEINSEALNNYFYIFFNIADCLQLLFIYYSLDGYYRNRIAIDCSEIKFPLFVADYIK